MRDIMQRFRQWGSRQNLGEVGKVYHSSINNLATSADIANCNVCCDVAQLFAETDGKIYSMKSEAEATGKKSKPTEADGGGMQDSFTKALMDGVEAKEDESETESLFKSLMQIQHSYCFIPPDMLQRIALEAELDAAADAEEHEFRKRPPGATLRHCESKEPRPPLYNAEAYALGLCRWGRKGGTRQYIEGGSASCETGSKDKKDKKKREAKNTGNRQEMTMKQFANVSELLKKLRQDLRMSYPSFVREFVSDPYDGVTGLLDLLKTIQMSQTDYAAAINGTIHSKEHHNFFRRALTDEFDCLLCLRHCLRCEQTAGKMVGYSHGLYTVAVCIMSNFSKSRILAVELLTVACETPPRGYRQVMEAASTLRLRFGEPVRFKFLVGMLTSYSTPSFQLACLRFLNRLADVCPSKKERVQLQSELEEAGFDANIIRKFFSSSNNEHAAVREELDRWQDRYLDVDELCHRLSTERGRADKFRTERDALSTEVKKQAMALQTMRRNEHLQSVRVEQLETQIESLANSRESTNSSLTATTQQPPVDNKPYPSFPPPPSHSVSSTVSSSSTMSSMSSGSDITELPLGDVTAPSANKEATTEEKEKESAGEGDQTSTLPSTVRRARGRLSPSDFEKEKICEETIEVKNEMIVMEPHRGRSASAASSRVMEPHRSRSASAASSRPSKTLDRRTYQNVPGPCGRRSCESDDVREAMHQLTTVIDNAECSLRSGSGDSTGQLNTLAQFSRASRGQREGHIVTSRLPQPPSRSESHQDDQLEQEQYAEDSLTCSSETVSSCCQRPTDGRPSSAVETESTRSFHYARGSGLYRRDTFTEEHSLAPSRRGAGVQRSGSFHQGTAVSEAVASTLSRRYRASHDHIDRLEARAEHRGREVRDPREVRQAWEEEMRRARSRDAPFEPSQKRREPERSSTRRDGRHQTMSRAELIENAERYQRAAEQKMQKWLLAKRQGDERHDYRHHDQSLSRQQRRKGSDGSSGSNSGSGTGGDESNPTDHSHGDVKRSNSRGSKDYGLPAQSGFLNRGNRNAGRYSARRHVEIPSPDYSSAASSMAKLNMSNRIMDMASALY